MAGKWYFEYLAPQLVQAARLRQVLYSGHTAYQQVEVLDTVPFGRLLVLDGKTQSAEADEFVYHESLVHPAMVTHPGPQRVLIAGGGEGATLREVLAHRTVRQAVMVDLDREVVDICQRYLPNHHQGAFEDPRVQLHYQDASAFVAEHSGAFDVVVLDLSDPTEGGPAYLLYTQEFYSLVQAHTAPGGLVVTQAGPCGPINYEDVFTTIHRTMSAVFPSVFPYRVYMPSFGTSWGFVIGSLDHNPLGLTAPEIDQRLEKRGVRTLRHYDGLTHHGLFALPKYIRQGIAREERLITRDHPVFAF
ncbi:MAG: polyamine aminopropyltransferase [Chloroflexi bacterium]|nr:polyamine aminopropyltransferase [Chloroflexota bacterium]